PGHPAAAIVLGADDREIQHLPGHGPVAAACPVRRTGHDLAVEPAHWGRASRVARPEARGARLMTGSFGLLAIRNYSVHIPLSGQGVLKAIDDVSLEVGHGEAVGIVGESGSGKSMLVAGTLGLLPRTALPSGAILINDTDVIRASPRELRRVRGREIG